KLVDREVRFRLTEPVLDVRARYVDYVFDIGHHQEFLHLIPARFVDALARGTTWCPPSGRAARWPQSTPTLRSVGARRAAVVVRRKTSASADRSRRTLATYSRRGSPLSGRCPAGRVATRPRRPRAGRGHGPPSFTIARLMWVLAVSRLTTHPAAISSLQSPAATTSAITSR